MPKTKKDVSKSKSSKQKEAPPPLLPVTILSGFLGAGKTTLLKHILESNQHQMKIAVIVNDMAELNIDSSMVEKSGFVQAEQEVVSMQNGCICCTLRTDLIREINRLQKMGGFDYLVIESTGISEPMQVAESFCADPDTQELADSEGDMLWNTSRLDTLVTVVDILSFPSMMNSLQNFNEAFAATSEADQDEEGEKDISQLLLEQVEFANVIVLNKCDLVNEKEQASVQTLLKTLNPTAKIVLSSFGKVEMSEILNTKLFEMKDAQVAPGWLQSLHSKDSTEVGFAAAAANSESEEYGVSSFVYRQTAPFHPERLYHFVNSIMNFSGQTADSLPNKTFNGERDVSKLKSMQETYGWILRSKGFCWIAGRDDVMAEWAQAGRFVSITPMMNWYIDQPEEEWGVEGEKALDVIREQIKPGIGDRRQEIVFIGTELKKDVIEKELDACLLTPEELDVHDMQARNMYNDPLPCWIQEIGASGPMKMWNTVLREKQMQLFTVDEGLELELGCISLNCVIPDDCSVDNFDTISSSVLNVQVWFDYDHQSSLLCTLRPEKCEQVPLNLTMCRSEIDKDTGVTSPYSLRMVVQHSRKKGRSSSVVTPTKDWTSAVSSEPCYEVHCTGTVLPVRAEEEEEEEEEEACPLPSKGHTHSHNHNHGHSHSHKKQRT